MYLLAFLLHNFRRVRTIEEFAFEQLHSNYSEDELEKNIYDHNVQHILQGIHHAVKYGLWDKEKDHL